MYILGQDKKFIVRFVGDERNYIFLDDFGNICYGDPREDSVIYLGGYNPKEKAKKVLQEIFENMEWEHKTFEMPQDEEVKED